MNLERRFKALELRKCGASYDAIARTLNISKPTAYKDVKEALEEINKSSTTDLNELRSLELERLDMALRAIAPQVRNGDLEAITRFTRIIDLRCRILGLYSATEIKLEAEVTNTVTPDYSQLPLDDLMRLYNEKLNGLPEPRQITQISDAQIN